VLNLLEIPLDDKSFKIGTYRLLYYNEYSKSKKPLQKDPLVLILSVSHSTDDIDRHGKKRLVENNRSLINIISICYCSI
jgi:hypothetical protein